jgi:hypothetical protein
MLMLYSVLSESNDIMWLDLDSLGSAVTGGSPAGKEAGNGMLLIYMPHSPSTLLTSFLVLVNLIIDRLIQPHSLTP